MTEAPPVTDMAELFQRDPLKLTKSDITAIVTRFRQARGQFNLGIKQAGAAKKVKEPTQKDQKMLDLGKSLGLDLDL